MDEALASGRLAVEILEAPPLDGHGYTDDEIAAHYAATDRLVAAFKRLDQEIVSVST